MTQLSKGSRLAQRNELAQERETEWLGHALREWKQAPRNVPFAALPKRARCDLHRALGWVLLCLESNHPGRALKYVARAKHLVGPSADLMESLRKLAYLERMGQKAWAGPFPPHYPFHHYAKHFGAVVIALHERQPRLLLGLQREALVVMRRKTGLPVNPWPVWQI